MIEFALDGIYIRDEHGEIVCWVEDEWKEDPDVVYSIVNAVRMYYEEGSSKLRETIGREV